MLDSLNWIDLVCLGVIVLGGLSGLTRGFTREFIGLFGWVIAASLANRWYPELAPEITPYINNKTLVDIVSFIVIFLISSIVINILANLIVGHNSTHFSLLGRLDRILGAACGVLKGYAGLAILYILGGIVFPNGQWPDTLQETKAIPYIYQGALYVNELLPSSMQRDIVAPQTKESQATYPTNIITNPNKPLPVTEHTPPNSAPNNDTNTGVPAN